MDAGKPDNVSERDWRIYQMRESGMIWRKIAEEVGLSATRVRSIRDRVWIRSQPKGDPLPPWEGHNRYSNASLTEYRGDVASSLFIRSLPVDWNTKQFRNGGS